MLFRNLHHRLTSSFPASLLRPATSKIQQSTHHNIRTFCQCSRQTFARHTSNPRFSVHNPLINKRTMSKTPAAKRGPVTWASLGVFLLTGAGIVFYVRKIKEEKEIAREKERHKSVGMAAIGGPFELVNTEGKTVTHEDFFGKWVLLYFGFCHCPDICPDQLDKITEIVDRLEKIPALPKLQPLFITVDPHRDTVESIKEYIKDFHPRMVALTGSEEQVKKVCKVYRVYYSSGPKDEDEDYIVDHTVIMYLLNPEGEFVEYFGQNRSVEEITGAISTKMAMARKKNS